MFPFRLCWVLLCISLHTLQILCTGTEHNCGNMLCPKFVSVASVSSVALSANSKQFLCLNHVGSSKLC